MTSEGNTEKGLATFESRNSSAVLSADGQYRYELTRRWDNSTSTLTFVMLNPSTADASIDDPTIRRCIGFAQSAGFGGLRVLNLYAFRATQPKDMFRAIDPVGPENDSYISGLFAGSTVIAAWGANARPDRVRQVRRLLANQRILCLGVTKDGHPKHPLYVPAAQPFVPFGSLL